MRTLRCLAAADLLFKSVAHLCLGCAIEDIRALLPGRETYLHPFFPSLSNPGAKTDVGSASQGAGHGKLCSNPSCMSAHSMQPEAVIHDVDGYPGLLVLNLHLNHLGMSMPKSVRDCLPADLIDFIAYKGIDLARLTFAHNAQFRLISNAELGFTELKHIVKRVLGSGCGVQGGNQVAASCNGQTQTRCDGLERLPRCRGLG